MSNYQRYKKIKYTLKSVLYKNLDIERVCASIIARGVWVGKLEALKFLFMKPSFGSEKREFKTLMTYAFNNRKDHLDKVHSYCEGKNIEKSSCVEISRKLEYSLSNIFSSIKCIVTASSVFLQAAKYELNFNDKIILYASIVYCIRQLDYFNSLNITCDTYIAYNSADLEEAALCTIFNRVNTYGLQHGMYFNYNNDIPLDVINYENINSKYFVAWGEYTLDQVGSSLPDSVEKIVSYDFHYLKPTKNRKLSSSILVLLPRLIYKVQIIELLEVLSEFKEQKIFIKVHPSLLKDNELLKLIKSTTNSSLITGTVDEVLSSKKFKCVISFNSTVLFESILYGQNTFFFNSTSTEFVFKPMFTNFEELNSLINQSSNNDFKSDKVYFFANRADYLNERVI